MRSTLLTLLAAAVALTVAPFAAAATHATTVRDVSVCRHAGTAKARCFAIRVDQVRHGRVRHAAAPAGYGPGDLRAAYALPSTSAGDDATVAIVDAYDDPRAEADLAVYRAQFNLPPCTATNGCFTKVDQRGGTDLPDVDPGWSEEISLDLDMASAVCPNCRLLLVEADSASMAALGTAVRTAVSLGANAVSNSWGGPDMKDQYYGRYFHHPGVAITASAGDDGYGTSYPASSKWVTAVGGTTLRRSSARRGFSESAWPGSGSGCSAYNTAPWQDSATTGCAGRAVADVSAVADPATGVAVFDSLAFQDASGWLTFGGTSASSPIIATVFALAGNTADVRDGSYVWTHRTSSNLNDIHDGSNGSCDVSQQCTARNGWDGPTGFGSPDGTAAF
ncbi:MAG TPA: S53 family peptidase [Mycobacteriales bacterium]|nr:S53 family peptidase [Mycobacteriales bacterium]